MKDEKMVTEREAVKRERAAYRRATRDRAVLSGDAAAVESRVVDMYPFPSITRPREVRLPDSVATDWRYVNERFEVRQFGGEWERADQSWPITAKYVAFWADLLANPTETVEAE